RAGQDAGEHVGGAAPGSLGKLEPVELQLGTGLVRELDRGGLAAAAAAAFGPEAELPDLTHERRVGAIEAELAKLAVKDGREQVRVVGEASLQVAAPGLERARRAAALGLPAAQTPADRLRVAAGVAGDRRDRPAASA